ncbi:MAG: hypothetical protein AB8B50_03165 [Pirellulaceae bacterium]
MNPPSSISLSKTRSLDGRSKRLGPERALVLDVIDQARKIPSFPVERSFAMQSLAEARERAGIRVSWAAIFMRAYGLASRDIPELRQFYFSFPWPRFYQSAQCTIAISVNRVVDGKNQLFFGRLRSPDRKNLWMLQSELDRLKSGSIERVFRDQLAASRFPRWVRRSIWFVRSNFQLDKRANRTGTASISVLAGQGVLNRRHPCIMTSSLSYGPMDEESRMWVTLQCDHRLIDGCVAAQALNCIDEKLQTNVLSELRSLSLQTAAA